jgi:acyl-coenzyme A synthetase/AMP-(fatty) acid ligase
VAQCVVVGVDEAARGEEVCAIVVPSVAEVDLGMLAERAREQLSAYKVPTRWAVVTIDQIPTLPSGKCNRKALRALVDDGVVRSRRIGDVGARDRPEAPREAPPG